MLLSEGLVSWYLRFFSAKFGYVTILIIVNRLLCYLLLCSLIFKLCNRYPIFKCYLNFFNNFDYYEQIILLIAV